tara:strand:+ start:1137 stop:1244 length:108 start_codon:yes stop_codon:yes gene_type:complete
MDRVDRVDLVDLVDLVDRGVDREDERGEELLERIL